MKKAFTRALLIPVNFVGVYLLDLPVYTNIWKSTIKWLSIIFSVEVFKILEINNIAVFCVKISWYCKLMTRGLMFVTGVEVGGPGQWSNMNKKWFNTSDICTPRHRPRQCKYKLHWFRLAFSPSSPAKWDICPPQSRRDFCSFFLFAFVKLFTFAFWKYTCTK